MYFDTIRDLGKNEIETIPSSIIGLTALKDL